MISKGQHVIPRGRRWIVLTSGASRARAVFSTQREAIHMAWERARKTGAVLYIHGRDGRIRERRRLVSR